MKQKYNAIIGIDPGTETGFAIWIPAAKSFHMVETVSILHAIGLVTETEARYGKILVRIENPHLRNWFGDTGREKLQGAGSIKRDFAIWAEFFGRTSIPYEEVAPKNLKTKVKPEYFRKLTGWKGRTSSHARDAAMMVFKYQ